MVKTLAQLRKEDGDVLNSKQGHPLEDIIQAKEHVMEFHIRSKFRPCQDCALGKAKRLELAKRL